MDGPDTINTISEWAKSCISPVPCTVDRALDATPEETLKGVYGECQGRHSSGGKDKDEKCCDGIFLMELFSSEQDVVAD